MRLQAGQNATLRGTKARVCLAWDPMPKKTPSVAAVILGANGKAYAEDALVFAGKRRWDSGLFLEECTDSGAVFSFDAASLPDSAAKIAFAIFLPPQGGAFPPSLAIRLKIDDTGDECHEFDFQPLESGLSALIAGEAYRKDGLWKFRALGQGFSGGWEAFAQNFGLRTAMDGHVSEKNKEAPGAKAASASPAAKLQDEMDVLIRSRHSLLYLLSSEEDRGLALLRSVAEKGANPRKLARWTCVEGFSGDVNESSIRDPVAALDLADKQDPQKHAIFVFLDMHPFLQNPLVVRRLRTLAQKFQETKKTLVLISPVLVIPPELEKLITVVDFALPPPAEIEGKINDIIKKYEGREGITINLAPEDRQNLVQAAAGLTLEEVENVLGRLLVREHKITPEAVTTIFEEKRKIIRKTGILEFFPASENPSQVGGLENLKNWLQKRSRCFSNTLAAREAGIEPPKGVLLTGVPGCGKSLTVKAAAGMMRLPLLRLDVGKVFEGLVGSSERNMRTAIATAEAAAPAVLWIDEIEKGFPSGRGGDLDGGTSSRVFASFLTWMQEKTSPVFVMATSNNVSRLPPEMLRKGRFDEIFFVDLPVPRERREIFSIHLERRHKNPAMFDLDELAALSEGFSGAEIEEAIRSALLEAFDAGRPLVQEDISLCLKRTPPLSRTMAEDIEAIRLWANERAVRASLLPPGPSGEASAKAAGRAIEF